MDSHPEIGFVSSRLARDYTGVSATSGFDVSRVSVAHKLEDLRGLDQIWKVRLIEGKFQTLMFGVKDV